MKDCDGIDRLSNVRASETEGNKVERFIKFIIARHAIYIARRAKQEPPWTKDRILQRYKFCNIYRELDRVTRWISVNWRRPHQDDPDFWFAALVARRCINFPATLAAIGYPIPWNPNRFLEAIERRKESGKLFISNAYKVILSGQAGNLAEVQVKMLLNPAWRAREELRPRREDTLTAFHMRLARTPYVGNFHAAQVIADAKYGGALRDANDWWQFAASGPGSKRGLNRVLGRPVNASWIEREWLSELRRLRKIVGPAVKDFSHRRMDAQNLQNCLCEFDKYERVRLGEGKTRKFEPKSAPLP